jgi:predicted NAD-dependent protein-ADP-ribosyltransferase YbiA (DUF1768 family)
MNLDRKAIEARKAKINQDDVDKFIDGADKPNEQKVTGRPRRNFKKKSWLNLIVVGLFVL